MISRRVFVASVPLLVLSGWAGIIGCNASPVAPPKAAKPASPASSKSSKPKPSAPKKGMITYSKMANLTLYVGTYAGANDPGIYTFNFDTTTGKLTKLSETSGVANPSFLAFSPDGNRLYAASEIAGFNGNANAGAVYAFSVAGDGKLSPLGTPQSSGGAGPCHVSVSPDGKAVFAANYGGGTVASYSVQADGSLSPASVQAHQGGSGVNKSRQDKPYAHSLLPDPTGKWAVSADLGADKLFVYKVGADGKLTSNNPASASTKPGAGPRHIAWNVGGNTLYVINELNSTVGVYAFDSKAGTLTEKQVLSTLPAGFDGSNSPSEILVGLYPTGTYVYGANRGHNSIAVYKADKDGKLTLVEIEKTGGKNPRNFTVDPYGTLLLVAHQDTSDIIVFKIDQATGKISPTGEKVSVPKAVCVRFRPVPSRK